MLRGERAERALRLLVQRGQACAPRPRLAADGVGDFAVCLDINPGKAGDPSSVLGQVLASITQTQVRTP